MRLDTELVKRKLVISRSRALFLIKEQYVRVNGIIVDKPSMKVLKDDKLCIDFNPNPWVSRGGVKLDSLFKSLSIKNLSGTALDIGSSKGGFTEVLLKYGVDKVYSIDVGKNQMDKNLKKNKNIFLFEGLNVKDMRDYLFPNFDIIVCDVSFISLKKFLTIPLRFSHCNTKLFILLKPQFELERKINLKNGILKDKNIQNKVCLNAKNFLKSLNWKVTNIKKCEIKGNDGNQEYFIVANKSKM